MFVQTDCRFIANVYAKMLAYFIVSNRSHQPKIIERFAHTIGLKQWQHPLCGNVSQGYQQLDLYFDELCNCHQ